MRKQIFGFMSDARRLLERRQCRFTLRLASFFLILITLAWRICLDRCFSFFDLGPYAPVPPRAEAVAAARMMIDLFGTILLLMPLRYGLYTIAMAVATGEGSAEAGRLFAAFSSVRTLRRVWRCSVLIVWRAALSGVLVYLTWHCLARYGAALPQPLSLLLCALAAAITPLLLFPLVGTHLLYPLLIANPTMRVTSVLRTAAHLALGSFGDTLLLWGMFLFRFALAYATGGVLLIFVIPYFVLTDTVRVCSHMTRRGRPITISTKEINHVQ